MANTRSNNQQKQEKEAKIKKLKNILDKEEIDILKLEEKIKKHRERITETEHQLYQLIPKPKSKKKTPKTKSKSTQVHVNDLPSTVDVTAPAQPPIDQATQVHHDEVIVVEPTKPSLDVFGASIFEALDCDALKTRLKAKAVKNKARRGSRLEYSGRKLAELDTNKDKDAILGPCTNNLEADSEENIKRLYRIVTKSASRRYRFVFVSSLLPRSELVLDSKIRRINRFLELLCDECDNLVFVDNDLFFRDSKDSRIHELFRSPRNIHPSTQGTKVLEDSICSAITGYYCASGLSL